MTSLRKGNREKSVIGLEERWLLGGLWSCVALSAQRPLCCLLSISLGALHHRAQNATVSFPGTAPKSCELIQQEELWLSSKVEQGFDRNFVSRLITGTCHPI